MARRSSPGGKISACLPRLRHSTKTCHILKPTLSTDVQESQKIFKAEYPMENVEATKTKLIGYGFQLLEGDRHMFWRMNLYSTVYAGIDPNPDNFVCAGIIHTRAVQIGVLLRLEPNKQAEVQISLLPYWNVLILAKKILTQNQSFHMYIYFTMCHLATLQMYRLTTRSSKESVSQYISGILCEQF